MIAKNEMIPLVLDACPSFLPTWEILQHDRKGSSEDTLHNRAVVALARHLISGLQAGTDETPNAAQQFLRLLGIHPAEHWNDCEEFGQVMEMIDRWNQSRTAAFPQLDLESIKDPKMRSTLQSYCKILKPY